MAGRKAYFFAAAASALVIALGAAVYLVFESFAYAIAFVAASFIVILAAGLLLPGYYRRISYGDGKRDEAVRTRKIELAHEICESCLNMRKCLEEAGREIDAKGELGTLGKLGDELSTMRCFNGEFDVDEPEIGRVSITMMAAKKAEVDDRLGAIDARVSARYSDRVRRQAGELLQSVEMLGEAGYSIGDDVEGLHRMMGRGGGLAEEIAKGKEIGERVESILKKCSEEAAELSKISGGKAEQLRGSVKERAEALMSARKKFSQSVKGDFSNLRSSLLYALDAVVGSLDNGVPEEARARFESIREEVKKSSDPGRIAVVRRMEAEYRETVKGIVEDANSRLAKLESEIAGQKPPEQIWKPAGKIPALVDDSGVRKFARNAKAVLDALRGPLENSARVSKILKSYPKVEMLIDYRLAEKGWASPKELDVKYAKDFLLVYRKNHPGSRMAESSDRLYGKGAKRGEE